MTVETTNAYDGPYAANGVTTEFPFTFRAMSSSELGVLVTDEDGTSAFVAPSSVTVDEDGGGTVTMGSPPADGSEVRILSLPTFTQLYEFGSQDWNPNALNRALDRLTVLIQFLKNITDHAVTVQSDETGFVLPGAADRASNVLAFDQDGDVISLPIADATLPSAEIRFSVADYGVLATNNAATNNSGFADAIEAVQDAGGGFLHIPAGTFDYTSIVIPAGASVHLVGEGKNTVLRQTAATGTGIDIQADDSSLQYVRLTASVARSNYDPFLLLSGGNCWAAYNFIDADKCGIKMTGVNADVFYNSFSNGVASARRIWATGGDNSQSIHDNLMHYQASPAVESGIYTDDSAALKIYDNDIVGQGNCLMIAPAAGQIVVSLRSRGNFYDSATCGMKVVPSAGGQVVRCYSTRDWFGSHSSSGVILDSSSATGSGGVLSFEIKDMEAVLNGDDGVSLINSRTAGVRILGGTARNNTDAGISVGTSVIGFEIIGVRLNSGDGLNANAYGIKLAGSNGFYTIRDNELAGTTAALSGHSGYASTSVVVRNGGYVTENSGTGQVNSGASSAVITHGLGEAPRAQDIRITAHASTGSTPLYVDTTSITSSQFTVRTPSNAAANIPFGWSVRAGDRT